MSENIDLDNSWVILILLFIILVRPGLEVAEEDKNTCNRLIQKYLGENIEYGKQRVDTLCNKY